MAEIVGTAVGVISLGIQVCGGLVEYYDAYSDYSRETDSIREQTQSLLDAFTLLQSTLGRHSFDAEIVQSVESSIGACKNGIERLRRKLDKFRKQRDTPSLRDRLVYPFRRFTLLKLQAIVAEQRSHVVATLDILQVDSAGEGLNLLRDVRDQSILNRNQTGNIEAIVAETARELKEVKDAIAFQKQDEHLKLAQEISDWLEAPDVVTYHENLLREYQTGTCLWFVDGKDFASWKSAPSSFLLLAGMTGCGKTVLSSIIIERLLQEQSATDNRHIAYFFFDFRDQTKQPLEKLVRSLLAQLFNKTPSTFQEMEELYYRCCNDVRKPRLRELQETLFHIIKRIDHLYIVIDGLDESSEREEVTEFLLRRPEFELPNLHVLVTSRAEDDIIDPLRPITTKIITVAGAQVDSDIQLYVRSQLNVHRELKRWPDDGPISLPRLVGAANIYTSRFRLVACQLEILKRCRKYSVLMKTLASLPQKLSGTYERILCDIDEMYEDDVYTILLWLAFVERPLRMEEAAEVVSIAADEDTNALSVQKDARLRQPRDALRICSSMVSTTTMIWSIDKQYNFQPVNVIVLAHSSVKEFLVSNDILRSKASKFWLEKTRAHSLISEASLTYLLQFDKPDSLNDDTFLEHPLAEYSAQFWTHHSRSIEPDQWSPALETMSMSLLTSDTCFSNSIRIWDPSQETYYTSASCPSLGNMPPNPLHFAATLGIERAGQLLLDGDQSLLSEADEHGCTALHFAAGSLSDIPGLVSSILEHGVDIDEADQLGKTALHLAVDAENISTISALLQHGANIEAKSLSRLIPLHYAIANGKFSAMRVLLESRAGIGARAKGGLTVIHLCVDFDEHGPTALDTLLEYGADIDAVDVYGDTALNSAAGNGQKSLRMAELLLQRKAKIGLGNEDGYNPLHTAVRNTSCSEMVELLLRYGAVTSLGTCDGDTPLHLAVQNPEAAMQMAQLLLKHGAAVSAQNNDLATPLHHATALEQGGAEMMSLLLKAGADINAESDIGNTPLDDAVFHKVQANIDFLLSNGARPTSEDKSEKYKNLPSISDIMDEAAKSVPAPDIDEMQFAAMDELSSISANIEKEGLSRQTVDKIRNLLPAVSQLGVEHLPADDSEDQKPRAEYVKSDTKEERIERIDEGVEGRMAWLNPPLTNVLIRKHIPLAAVYAFLLVCLAYYQRAGI
ncbi:hypothetical protein AJ80_02930 [Polytolypa hystricis UAMH7299]|uniref:NACHT domain-containing protein n=1 Tax=Polytolypa hystricis (strain UAMH7299) TaxID=1447883 RepID=A0A2B7YNY5_POLH7|nr:hypothetical protein AJ80_02930 [Polytolypa hystricis UAMH7299]